MDEEPSVTTAVMNIQARTQGQQRCALGLHAWVPWLSLPNGSYTTWCVLCKHTEQYDI